MTGAGRQPFAIVALLCALAAALAAARLGAWLPVRAWPDAALHPGPTDIAQLIVHYGVLPRLAAAALCGAGLALAGGITQHVLGNPLASPVTLGVAAGAKLLLLVGTLAWPAALAGHRFPVALLGGVVSMAVVLGIASRMRFSSLGVILAGLAVGLFLGALGTALQLFNREYLGSAALWAAGSLVQDDWSASIRLLPTLAGAAIVTALLLRPLALFGLSEGSAKGLGLSLAGFRIVLLLVAVVLASGVTASVGIIGFVDIAAPLAARLMGARRIGPRLVLASLLGAAMLVIVDIAVQACESRLGTDVPTGAVTAFMGAPLLLALLPRLKLRNDKAAATAGLAHARRIAKPWRLFIGLVGLTVLVGGLAVIAGHTGTSWSVLNQNNAALLLPWRVPRLIAAFSAGSMLATAGVLLQRITGNPLAGPEVLGLGAAVMGGIVVALLIWAAPSAFVIFAMGAGGAGLLLAAMLGSGLRHRFAPDHLLLTGVALGAAVDALVIVFLAANDPRADLLLGYMAGSTAGKTASGAALMAGTALLLVPPSLLFARSLDLLSMGEGMARGLGLAAGKARFALMVLASLLTAAAVLGVGPLTFVGLIGPHLASRLGLQRPLGQIGGAALLGGLIMVAADWLGRVAAAPFEVPAGLVASLIGIPILLVLLCGRTAAKS